MADHNIFEMKQMASLNVDSLVRTVVVNAELEQGTPLVLGEALETIFGETEIGTYGGIYVPDAKAPICVVDGDLTALADGEYDVGLVDPRKYSTPANEPVRVRLLVTGDEFIITPDLVTGTLTNEDYIVADTANDGKYAFASAVDGRGFAAKILDADAPIWIGRERVSGYLVRVVRNENLGVFEGALEPAAAVADSTATDVEGIVTDFNGLLASLRTAGILAE